MTSSTPQSQADLSLATLKRLDQVCAAYESAWKAGKHPRLEDYVTALDEPERTTRLRELLKLEVELRTAAGQTVSAAEYYPRFPEHTELIGALLAPAGATIAGSQDQVATPSTTGTAAETPESAHADLLTFLQPPTKPGTLGRLGPYEIQEVVGRGGMGVVLKGFDERLQRIVAIKVLGPQYAANAAAQVRFKREARSAAAVVHDHIVAIHDIAEAQGLPFLVMQLIVGKSLQDRLDQSGPLGLKEILRIGAQIAHGLAAAHKNGVVHRDIKPANILLENGVERVKITDFGLARAVDDASVTQSGVITGTPMFMAPEQARGEQVDKRADLFSLGSVMYAMCTGHSPFRASGTHAVLMRVIEDTPRPIQESNPELPDWLNDIVMKLLAKKPEDRFQEAKEVAELLEQHLAHVQQPHIAPKPAPVKVVAEPAGAKHRAIEKILEASDQSIRLLQNGLAGAAMLLFFGGVMLTIFTPASWQIYSVLFAAGAAAMTIASRFRQHWEVGYRGHVIRFENGVFTGEALFIDGLRVAAGGCGLRRELRGVISTGDAAGDEVMALVESGLTQVRCRIFIEEGAPAPKPSAKDQTVEETRPISRSAWPIVFAGSVILMAILFVGVVTASTALIQMFFVAPVLLLAGIAAYGLLQLRGTRLSRDRQRQRPATQIARSSWSRLAWTLSAYLAITFVLAIFIAGYSDGGWWATPWIEFIAAPAFLAFAFWQWGRGIRPRWLPVIPVLLAILAGSLGLVIWPFSTERHFCRLVRIGRYEAANQLLAAPDRFSIEQGQVVFRGKGAAIRFGDQDLPLYCRAGDWDHFEAHLLKGADDEFPFYLGAGADDRCKLHFSAAEGVIRYQMVRFTDLKTQRRMMPDSDEQQKPDPVAAKLPENAEEVLAAMVGSWRTEATHKIVNGKPLDAKSTGATVVDWAAGKRFLRLREQTGPNGVDFLQIYSQDPATKEFRSIHFDARGFVLGPTTSRWDTRTHTLTGTSVPDAQGLSVKNTRFLDPNTLEWELIVRDKTSKIIFESYAKLTRSADAPTIREDETPAPVPKEMAPLHKLAGDWQTTGKLEAKAIGLLKLPVLAAPLSKHSAEKILGGRYVEVRETLTGSPNESNYALLTYDTLLRRYRMWTYAPSGYQNELRGAWDAKDDHWTWTWSEPDPGQPALHITAPAAGTLQLQWRGADTYESTVEVRNFNNGIIADAQSTTMRQKSALLQVTPNPDAPKAPETPASSDRGKLRGVWKAVQVGAKGGKPLEPVPDGLAWTFRIDDSKAVVQVKAHAPFAPKLILVDKSYDGNLVVDDAAQPKRLSLVKPGGNITSLAGIYRWEGQRLVLSCYFDPKEGPAYPSSFTPGDDKDAVHFVLERQP